MSTDVLEIESLTKRYPGTLALDDVSLRLGRHEVIGLIGENGAGKSTLLKILTGVQQADSGHIVVHGRQVRFRNILQAGQAGLSMVFQEQSLIPNISVAENIMLGHEAGSTRLGFYRWRSLNERAARQLRLLGITIPPETPTEQLTFGQRQMVELAKALAVGERTAQEPIVLLDEPTSVLDGDEIETLFAQIERMRDTASVVFVSHRMEEVLRVADRVYVMRDGRVVAELDRAECDRDRLVRLMVGRSTDEGFYGGQQPVKGEPVLSVRDLSLPGGCRGVSFELAAGEILGVAGVIGSGREGLCRALFGAAPGWSGRILLDDRRLRLRSPYDAVRAGIGCVPSERRLEGLAMGLDVGDNMTLAFPQAAARGPFVRPRGRHRLVAEWMDKLRVKAPSARVPVDTLSGGNQQKVVLSKWLLSDRLRVLILDHPTRGLDVGAKQEVYELIRDLSKSGIAVILLADTLEEIIALSHTILVMRDGEVTARFDAPHGAKPGQAELLEHML